MIFNLFSTLRDMLIVDVIQIILFYYKIQKLNNIGHQNPKYAAGLLTCCYNNTKTEVDNEKKQTRSQYYMVIDSISIGQAVADLRAFSLKNLRKATTFS